MSTENSSSDAVQKVSPLIRISRSLKSIPVPRPIARWVRKRLLAGAPQECVADVLGFKMRLHPHDQIDGSLLTVPRFYDATEIAFLLGRLHPGDVFVDLGSHIGFYTLNMARAVGPAGKVIAVEATPETFKRLQENVAMNALSHVRCLNVGVSDKEETLRLAYRGSDNTGGNSFMFDDTERGVEMPCLPLLEILRREGVTSVTAAKLDIEGFEFRVLDRFFADADKSLYPGAIVIELNYEVFPEESGKTLALLEAHGYRTEATTHLNHLMVLDS
jgi:FkbM family methyltransferase